MATTTRTSFRPDPSLAKGEWRDRAACLYRPDLFVFPRPWWPDYTDLVDEAKDICRGCPVLADCFEYAQTKQGRQVVGVLAGRPQREGAK